MNKVARTFRVDTICASRSSGTEARHELLTKASRVLIRLLKGEVLEALISKPVPHPASPCGKTILAATRWPLCRPPIGRGMRFASKQSGVPCALVTLAPLNTRVPRNNPCLPILHWFSAAISFLRSPWISRYLPGGTLFLRPDSWSGPCFQPAHVIPSSKHMMELETLVLLCSL